MRVDGVYFYNMKNFFTVFDVVVLSKVTGKNFLGVLYVYIEVSCLVSVFYCILRKFYFIFLYFSVPQAFLPVYAFSPS